MKKFLKIMCPILAVLAVFCIVVQLVVMPHGDIDISREYMYSTEEDARAANLPTEVTQDAKTYVLDTTQKVEYGQKNNNTSYEKEYEFTDLTEQNLPSTQTVEIDGKTYTLKLIKADYTEGEGNFQAEGQVVYEGYAKQPTIPETDEIIYEKNGEKIAVEGTLDHIEQTGGFYTGTFSATGRIVLPAGANAYIYNGKTIAYDANTPMYDGWRADAQAALGVNGTSVKITSAKWSNAGTTNSDGSFVRNITYTGTQELGDWTAYYVAEGERTTYNAKAIYGGPVSELGMDASMANANGAVVTAVAHYVLKSVANSGTVVNTLARNKAILPIISAILALGALVSGIFGFKSSTKTTYVARTDDDVFFEGLDDDNDNSAE